MEIVGTATATARTAAVPGRLRDETLGRGRSYGFFGDGYPRLTSDLAMAAGAAPRFVAVRCTRRAPLHVTSATASYPLIPAASARVRLTAIASPPLLPAAQGTAMHMKKQRQQIRCGNKHLPPTEIPWCFSVAVKISSEVATEIERICKFIWQYANEMWSRPEMAKVRLETSKIQIVLCNTLLNMLYNILHRVISATNEPSTVDGTTRRQMMPLPETPRCFSPLVKLSSELAKEMVIIANFFWQWTLYLWSRPETENLRLEMRKIVRRILLKILYAVISATNDPSEVDVRDAEPAKTRPPSNSQSEIATEQSPMSKATSQTEQASEQKTTQPISKRQPQDPWSKAVTHERNPMSKTSPETKQASKRKTTQTIPEQQPLTQSSKSQQNLKRRVNKMARELVMLTSNDNLLKLMKVLKRDFITCVVYSLAFVTCLWAWKQVASQSERAVACQLLAVQCWKAVLAYNLPEKLLLAGADMCDMVIRAGQACKELENSYKISTKLLALWEKVEKTGNGAEKLSTVWANIDNAYNLLLKLAKGGK